MYKSWWKILGAVLVVYSTIAGFLFKVPPLPILHQSIRNLYFHVPMWFSMITLFSISVFHSIKYLRSGKEEDDLKSVQSINAGIVFGILGLITGSVWARFTWGQR